MRWQRVTRLVLAAVGIGFAIAIYFLTRERPPATAEEPPPADLEATQVGGPGKSFITRGGRKIGEISFKSTLQYVDGRMRFEQATYVDERGFTISADSIVARGAPGAADAPKEMELNGNMTFTDKSGLRVRTARAVYNDADGIVTMPEEVTFERGRVSGRSLGAVYRRDTETVELLAEATATVAPDAAGAGGAQATSRTMTLPRAEKSLRMDDSARIVSDRETLAGDKATIYFTEDESAIRYLELTGHASVTPVDAQAGSAPDMRADAISLTFHPGGSAVQHATLTGGAALQTVGAAGPRSVRGSWIDLLTAPDGKTLTRLEARDSVAVALPATASAPAREICSATLLATGAPQKGLEVARFEKNVRFTEKTQAETAAAAAEPCRPSAGERSATAQMLTLTLGGDLEAINRAEFQRNAIFVDADVRADADIAVYDAANERLALSPGTWTPRRVPQVTGEKVTVNAPAIEIDMKTHDLVARGGVTTTSRSAASERRPALFAGDDPVYGTATEFAYQDAAGTATYAGKAGAPARVVQGKNEIEGAKVVLADEKGNIDASGGVRTVFLMDAPDKSAKPVEYTLTSQTFSYDDTKRVATYRVGAKDPLARMKSTDDNLIEGRTITLKLAAESRTLSGFVVTGESYAQLPGNYEAIADTLTYTADTDRYLLTGKARAKAPSSDGKGCVLMTGATIEFSQKTGMPRQPEGPGFATSKPIACTESIR